MTTVDERMTILETEFRTELKHLATKEDLANLRSDLRGDMKNLAIALATMQLIGLGVAATIMRFLS